MVVTEADPVARIVTEINAEPAGREYARLVGLDVDKLTPMIFATHPVVVKVGGRYYTRVDPEGERRREPQLLLRHRQRHRADRRQGHRILKNIERSVRPRSASTSARRSW